MGEQAEASRDATAGTAVATPPAQESTAPAPGESATPAPTQPAAPSTAEPAVAAPCELAAPLPAEPADAASAEQPAPAHGNCRNCGAPLGGAFCSICGQAAHLHRSLHSLGHDILHGVFHFEGKIWRTLPELFFHPGRLTRRYIDGERAKFVSPIALFLFAVFMMFAVFSFTGGLLLDSNVSVGPSVIDLAQRRTQAAETESRIAGLQRELADPKLSPQRRTELETETARETAALELARKGIAALSSGDQRALAEIDAQAKAQRQQTEPEPAPVNRVETGSPSLDRKLSAGLQRINENPGLLLYKLKTNGYKYSWALVPMSIPFLWVLFFWRRDIHLYDHAIFITYSISFVMLLLILCSLASKAGVSAGIWGSVLAFGPPIHLYKQLRGAYALSRFGAVVRLFLLQISIFFVLVLFSTLLLMLGLLD